MTWSTAATCSRSSAACAARRWASAASSARLAFSSPETTLILVLLNTRDQELAHPGFWFWWQLLPNSGTEGGVKGGAFRVFLSFLARGRVSSLPRPVSGLAFVSVGKRGALSVPLFLFFRRVRALRYGSGRSSLAKPNRWLCVRYADRFSPPPVLSPRMGGPGSSRRSRLAPGGAGGRVRRALPARPSPRPGPVVGRFPPSHATVARPTRTPSPSPTPRSGAGFPQGRWVDYRLRGVALDKLRARKMRK
jgi:hypothetical protein